MYYMTPVISNGVFTNSYSTENILIGRIRKFGYSGPSMMEKIPHKIFTLKCSFCIGYGIG